MRYLRAVQAKEIDRKLSVGLDPGLLAGIPFGIKVVSCCMCALEACFSLQRLSYFKDNICVSNMPSTAGMSVHSLCHGNHIQATFISGSRILEVPQILKCS